MIRIICKKNLFSIADNLFIETKLSQMYDLMNYNINDFVFKIFFQSKNDATNYIFYKPRVTRSMNNYIIPNSNKILCRLSLPYSGSFT